MINYQPILDKQEKWLYNTNMEKIISSEKELLYSLSDQANDAQVEKICKALSSPIRLQMVKQIIETPQTITQLAKRNGLTNSTIIFHLKILADANIINIRYAPGKKGFAQVCFINFREIIFAKGAKPAPHTAIHEQSMGVGRFVDAQFKTVGFATKDQLFHLSPDDAFSNIRFDAELLWTTGGRVTYAFGKRFMFGQKVTELRFSMEICSETSYYKNNWKSDISFAVNGKEIATYTSPGDYGGVRGKLNPDWWPNNLTQYGTLITLSITDEGTFLNNTPISKVALCDLALDEGNSILFSIYNKPDAKYYGGFNLFGQHFGNHEQSILLTAQTQSL